MAITTYAELKTAVTANWPHRADLTSFGDEFIALAEEKFNRRLRTKHQELALAETAIDASYQVAIPSNALAVKNMWRTDSPKPTLQAASLEFVIKRQVAGQLAQFYCQEDAKWRFDGTGSVAGVLYRSIPALSGSNTTNWLLTSHPSVYLYACLAEAATFVNDQAKAAMFEAKAEMRIADLQRSEHRDQYSGPLVVRVA